MNAERQITRICGISKGGGSYKLKVLWGDNSKSWVDIKYVNCPIQLYDYFARVQNTLRTTIYEQCINEKIDLTDLKINDPVLSELSLLGDKKKLIIKSMNDFLGSFYIKATDKTDVPIEFMVYGAIKRQDIENLIFASVGNVHLESKIEYFPLISGSEEEEEEFVQYYNRLESIGRYPLSHDKYNFYLIIKGDIMARVGLSTDTYILISLNRDLVSLDIKVDEHTRLWNKEILSPITYEEYKNMYHQIPIDDIKIYTTFSVGHDFILNSLSEYLLALGKEKQEIINSKITHIFLNGDSRYFYRHSTSLMNLLEFYTKIYTYSIKGNEIHFDEIYKKGGAILFTEKVLWNIERGKTLDLIDAVSESTEWKIFVHPSSIENVICKQLETFSSDPKIKKALKILKKCRFEFQGSDIKACLEDLESTYYRTYRRYLIADEVSYGERVVAVDSIYTKYFLNI